MNEESEEERIVFFKMKQISQTSTVNIQHLNSFSFFLVRVFFFISTAIDDEDVLRI
jgi:hypothetical protein